MATFDLDLWPWKLFRIFFKFSTDFWMAWPSNFIFGVEIHFRISRLHSNFKVMGVRLRSRQRKSGSIQVKNFWTEIAGMCHDDARSDLKLLTFDIDLTVTLRYFCIFQLKLRFDSTFLKCQCRLRVLRSSGYSPGHGRKKTAARMFVLSSGAHFNYFCNYIDLEV